MNIKQIELGRERHADNFRDGQIVFEGEGITIIVFQWNDKGRKTFDIYLGQDRVGSTSNYPKAIGMGLIAKKRKESAV